MTKILPRHLQNKILTVGSTYLATLKEYQILTNTRKQQIGLEKLNKPYFLIGLPGSLHIVELSMKLIPDDIDAVFVSNGLEKWEQDWFRRRFPNRSMILINKLQPHAVILDLLFTIYTKPFGILDYDLFVFDPTYLSKLQCIDDSSIMNALFCRNNPKINLDIPETFLLFFNPKKINQMKKKYHVSSKYTTYGNISKVVKNQIAKLGINEDSYPEDYKRYFDTLRLLMVVGLSDGLNINFIEKLPTISQPSNKIFHIGGVSEPNRVTSTWQTRGSYFWRRTLEKHYERDLQRRYQEEYGEISASEVLNSSEFSQNISSEFFEFVEQLLDKY